MDHILDHLQIIIYYLLALSKKQELHINIYVIEHTPLYDVKIQGINYVIILNQIKIELNKIGKINYFFF